MTRLTDLTPLDRLQLPVFCAVTPLARDLTTHLGKGIDAASARASAVMEAVERASAETMTGPTVEGSFEALDRAGYSVVDPTIFDLPSDSSYRPDEPITWVEAHDFLNDESVWIPRDLAISPPEEGVLREVDTNGLAAGNTLLEAVLHGLCEVIERDAVGQRLFVELFADSIDGSPSSRRVDPETVPDAVGGMLDRIAAADCEVAIQDVTTEIGVATFRAVIIDPRFPTPHGPAVRLFLGYGTDPNADVALLRSVTEAVQSRLAIVQGARDSFNRLPSSGRNHTGPVHLHDFRSEPMVPFSDVPSYESADLATDLTFVLTRMRRAGFGRVVAVDLTRPEWGIPVVRVRVPGLTSFLVNRRRPGRRCLRWLL